jgi:ketosteroid isomerase-like protein
LGGDVPGYVARVATDIPQLVRGAYDAWNAGDLERFISVSAPDVVLHTSGAFPDLPGEYRGHEGVRSFWRDVRGPWEELAIEVESVAQESDFALVSFRFRARGREGLEVNARFFQVGEVRDGLVRRIDAFVEESEAVGAFESWQAAERAA